MDDSRPARLWFTKGAHAWASRPKLPVRVLSRPSFDLQSLWSGSDLLPGSVRRSHPKGTATRGWQALPTKSRWTLKTCCAHASLAWAALRCSKESDASGFPAHPLGCCTERHCNHPPKRNHRAMHPCLPLIGHHGSACAHPMALSLVLHQLRGACSFGLFTSSPRVPHQPWP